ncbi:MFS transporter [Methanofollis formosanus]|uniref:MFS transporter n=1 Tax=Methanofollis formosanus TaxID=299308 RepID=A0A8G1EFY3_9EURY|nr:MFS transporter [Methanofollis formosanus]QYZ79215.1 MFS transporter [Methanofollis formosanus]
MFPDLKPKPSLSKSEKKQGLSMVIWDGLATQAMVTLTGGVFLVAFALELGASNTVIGLLAAIPPLAELLQVPAVYIIRKVRNRRLITVTASTAARLVWLLIAAIPFLFGTGSGVWVLVGAMLLYSTISSISHCSWNSWMHDLIPQQKIGAFFSRRMGISTALAVPLSIVAALFVDAWKVEPGGEVTAYALLFFGGCIAGLIGVIFLARTPEPELGEDQKPDFSEVLKEPFADRNFKNLLIFLGSWNFAINLAAPFFTVYMLQRIGLDISWVIALAVMSQIVSIIFFRVWGEVADVFSHKSVLQISGPIFILAIIGWTFTTLPDPYILTVPILIAIHILTGLSTAGVTLSTNYIGLKLAPKGKATAYLMASSITTYLAAGIAPALGGIFVDFFASREVALTITFSDPSGVLILRPLDFQHWDFFFFFAFLIGLYSLHRLSFVREEGEEKKRIVVHELLTEVRREMRNLSTAGGLRIMASPPVSEYLKPPKKEKRRRRPVWEEEETY